MLDEGQLDMAIDPGTVHEIEIDQCLIWQTVGRSLFLEIFDGGHIDVDSDLFLFALSV